MWRASLAAIVLAVSGCPAAPFTHGGPTTRGGTPAAPSATGTIHRAMPPPRIEVDPAHLLLGGLVDAEVIAHLQGPGSAQHLRLATVDGEAQVTYALGGDLRLPVSAGDRVRVRYYPERVGHAGSALVLAAADGRALAIVVRRDGLPFGVLPGGARVGLRDAPDRLAYTEITRLPSLCLVRVEHFDLALTTDEGTQWVPPGAIRRVTLANTAFDLVAFDASRLVDSACRDADPSHTSWALLAAPAETPSRPAP